MTTTSGDTAHYIISGQQFDAPTLPVGLYIVSTPIGNLRDITLRALETLAAVDLVLCEDTRHSARLLDHYGIRGQRAALHDHNETDRIAGILTRLGEGQALALISDAGTPLLSDPGFPLVRAVRRAGFEVFAIPGASALLAALVSAGLPTDKFTFFGFLPSKAGTRTAALTALDEQQETLIFYESPRRLAQSLAAMSEAFGENRQAVVALELTKRFERSPSGSLGDLTAQFSDVETKGEAVIVVSGASAPKISDENWQAALALAMHEQPLRTAVDDIARTYEIKRKLVYNQALAIKRAQP